MDNLIKYNNFNYHIIIPCTEVDHNVNPGSYISITDYPIYPETGKIKEKDSNGNTVMPSFMGFNW